MKNEEILNFILTNFSNNRRNLLPKINEYLASPLSGRQLKDEITKKIKIPFRIASFSSEEKRTVRTKRSEIGDISDIYTFCLNFDITKHYERDDIDWDFKGFLKAGKELHLCTLWVNWVIPVYYIETTYEFVDIKGKFNQWGRVKLTDEREKRIVESIGRILGQKAYRSLELDFLKVNIDGVSTDCSEKNNATIFECLFSDLNVPLQHIRKNIRKKKNSKYPELAFTEYLSDNRERQYLEAEIYHNAYSPLTIKFDQNNKIIETESRGTLSSKKHKTIKLLYV